MILTRNEPVMSERGGTMLKEYTRLDFPAVQWSPGNLPVTSHWCLTRCWDGGVHMPVKDFMDRSDLLPISNFDARVYF